MSSEWQYRGYWIPFPKPVPAVVGTAWNDGDLRTICVSSEWLPYILGALQVLTRRETYFGDPDDIEFSVEQANHILAEWTNGCAMSIMFQQTTPCLLEYSLDGGTTWTGMYNGQLCINENIADGTLAAGTTANPSQPVNIGGCQEFYIQVQEQTDFVLPTTVSTGDVITVSEVDGAWADGWLGNFWYCYDGSVFVFGVCISGSNPAKSGDPLTTGQHMQLVVKVDDTYYDALGGAITVPSGKSNVLVSLLPNNGSARSGGTGVVKCKVTVCNNGSWCHQSLAGKGNSTTPSWTPITNFGQIAQYDSGNDWFYSQNVSTDPLVWRTIQLDLNLSSYSGFTLTRLLVECEAVYPSDATTGSTATSTISVDSVVKATHSQGGSFIGTDTFTLDTGWISLSNPDLVSIYLESRKAQHISTSGSLKVTKITIYGSLTSPFGSSNCG